MRPSWERHSVALPVRGCVVRGGRWYPTPVHPLPPKKTDIHTGRLSTNYNRTEIENAPF